MTTLIMAAKETTCHPVIMVSKQIVFIPNTKKKWLFEQSYSEKDGNFNSTPNISGQKKHFFDKF